MNASRGKTMNRKEYYKRLGEREGRCSVIILGVDNI